MITFYKEVNFKETPFGKIPKNWEVKKLENVISSFQNGIWGDSPLPTEGSYPVIRSTEITHDGKIDLSTVAFRRISVDKVEKYCLEDGDILLVGSSGSSHLIGRAALFKHPNDATAYLFSNFMVRIRPKGINSEFLYYFLSSPRYYYFLKHLQQTSTGLRNLPRKEFTQIKLPSPPLQEQQKIAEVLSTVDEAIQKTNAVIAKTERLKKGLMQELLTKGIGHKEFKDTEIGRIPKDWKVVRLMEVGKFINGFGFPIEYQGKKDGRYIFVKVSDTNLVENEKYVSTAKNTIGDDLAKKLGVRIYPTGTIIFPKIGMVIYLRKVRILSKPGTFDNNIMGIIPAEDAVDNEFLYYYFLEKIDLTKLSGRTTAPSIRKTEVEKLKIHLPPLLEQQKIAGIVLTIDKKLELERSEKAKLERIKQRLMDLLLTGKIRVKVD